MQYAVFYSLPDAKVAAASIWLSFQTYFTDKVPQSEMILLPQVTNMWSAPFRRNSDGYYVVPICPKFTANGQALWVIQTLDSSWLPLAIVGS